MKETPSEVLLYIQKIKDFFNKSEETKNYFLSNVDEELFFKNVTIVSENNLTSYNEVMLTIQQFESIRILLLNDFDDSNDNSTFIFLDEREILTINHK